MLASCFTAFSSLATVWLRGSWKIGLGALMGTLIANILCLPLWTDYDSGGFVRTPFNTEARMEILYTGALTGANAFTISSSEPSLCTPTNYSYKGGDQLYIADLPIEGEWKPYSLTLKVRNRGSIRISLKGPQEYNDYGEIYSIPVDYRNLKIRDKEIFSGQRKVTHTKCFAHWIPVNANDTIKISFDVRRHLFNTDDFNLIKTNNFWYIITLSIFSFAVSCILLQRVSAMWKMRKTEDCCFLVSFFGSASDLLMFDMPMGITNPITMGITKKIALMPNYSHTRKGNMRLVSSVESASLVCRQCNYAVCSAMSVMGGLKAEALHPSLCTVPVSFRQI